VAAVSAAGSKRNASTGFTRLEQLPKTETKISHQRNNSIGARKPAQLDSNNRHRCCRFLFRIAQAHGSGIDA